MIWLALIAAFVAGGAFGAVAMALVTSGGVIDDMGDPPSYPHLTEEP